MRPHPTHQRQSHALTAQKSLDELERMTQNPATLKAYVAAINRFQKYGYSLQMIIDCDKRQRTDAIASYVRLLNDSGVTTATIRAELAALRRWMDCNRLDSDLRYLALSIKKDDIPQGGRMPYTDEDVSGMYQVCRNDQERLLLLFFATTGTRPGALFETEPLKISDIDTLTDDYATIKIYKDTKSEYDIILGKQFMQCINRLKKGGLFDDNPILFRDNKNGNRITKNNLDGIFKRLVREAKIDRVKRGNRYEKSLIYGLRKRYNTIGKSMPDVNYNLVEKLIGHSILKLDNAYLRPTPLQLLQEFKKFEERISIAIIQA